MGRGQGAEPGHGEGQVRVGDAYAWVGDVLGRAAPFRRTPPSYITVPSAVTAVGVVRAAAEAAATGAAATEAAATGEAAFGASGERGWGDALGLVVAGASEVEWASEGGGTVLGTTRAAAPTSLSPTPVDAAPAVALTGTGTGTGAGGGGGGVDP